jgi:glycolate oxidase iron-sulfur subunit
MKFGQLLRPLLPASLQQKVPAPSGARAHQWPAHSHSRKVLMLLGCVQPAMMPNVNAATARVLDAAGIQTLVADDAGCCGAIRTHLNDVEGGLDDMRRNIDAWWPLVEGLTGAGRVEAIVMNASGCGVTVKDYGHALAQDSHYAGKAQRISALTKDVSELLPDIVTALQPKTESERRTKESWPGRGVRLAYHPPCTLQHGQQLRGGVEAHLKALGFEIGVAGSESHLCCGSAGTYSVLQPELAYQLRDRKLGHLAPLKPQAIVSANIGCIQHLQSGTATPVRHWVEVLDTALSL